VVEITQKGEKTMTFKPTKEQIAAARNLFKAQAHLKAVRPVVIAYKTEILKANSFKVERRNTVKVERHNIVILDPKDAWLMSDDDFKKYHDLCNVARKQANLHVDNEEFCPLLVAEEAVRQAENAFMDTMEPITGMKSDNVSYHLDIRRKYIELSKQLMVNYV
jgi:hypothetical protein